MNSIVEKESYDYESGFSNFSDGFKFCYSEDGDICLSTDCSTWAKKLIHKLPLSDYIECESFVPPKVLHFPEFGTKKRTQQRKESVGNYIENCESCNRYMDTTFSFFGRLVCEQCNIELEKQKCRLCGSKNRIAELFCNEGKVYQSSQTQDYCLELTLYNMMSDYCENCYKEEDNSAMEFLQEGDDDFQNYNERRCRVCGDFTGDEENICYYCISLGF